MVALGEQFHHKDTTAPRRRLQVTGYGLRVAGYRLRVTGDRGGENAGVRS